MQEYGRGNRIFKQQRDSCWCEHSGHSPQDSCLTPTAPPLGSHLDWAVLPEVLRQRFVIFSWPLDPLAPLGPLYLHLGHFKEGTLENTIFRVSIWLFKSGCLVPTPDLGTDQHPACAALKLGVWFFLQGSWSKDVKGRGRTKMPKTSAGCCCICTLIFCSGWALPLTRKRLEILPLIMGQK